MSRIKTLKKVFVSIIFSSYIAAPLFANLENEKRYLYEKRNITKVGLDYLKKLPNYDYILGPGDLLEVDISNNYPELKTETMIDSEGTIYLPSINRIYVKGLTIDELRNLLNQSLKKFVKFPNVEVKILKYRPINFYTSGEIKQPGLHVLEGSLNLKSDEKSINYKFFPTIFDAIKSSEGFTRNADISSIEIVRKNNISNGGGKIKTILNFEKFLEGDTSQNIRIYDGDSILVKKSITKNSNSLNVALKTNINPKFIEVFVQGSVINPGSKRLPSQSSLNQAILFAGGVRVLNGPITHITFLNDGTYKSKKFNYKKNAKPGTFSNPFLNSKDIIFVNQGKFVKSSEVLGIITSPIVNLVSPYSVYKALTN